MRHVAGASLIAFATLGNPALAGELSEQAFQDSHVGKCLTYWGPTKGTQCFSADGTTSYDDEEYGTDQGTWRYRRGEICVTWSKEGDEICQTYTRNSDGTFSDESDYVWRVDG